MFSLFFFFFFFSVENCASTMADVCRVFCVVLGTRCPSTREGRKKCMYEFTYWYTIWGEKCRICQLFSRDSLNGFVYGMCIAVLYNIRSWAVIHNISTYVSIRITRRVTLVILWKNGRRLRGLVWDFDYRTLFFSPPPYLRLSSGLLFLFPKQPSL